MWSAKYCLGLLHGWRRCAKYLQADQNVPEWKHLAWRPSPEQIESAVSAAFGVDLAKLFAKRIRNNDARVAALYLSRMLTGVSTTELAKRYGGVSQAAVSKAVRRAEVRRKENRRWHQKLSQLEKVLRSGK